VGRWRSALSRDLTSVAKILGGRFHMDITPPQTENQDSTEE
jgi:hypothetical protein